MTQIEMLKIEIDQQEKLLARPNQSAKAIRMIRKRLGNLKKQRDTYYHLVRNNENK